MGASEYPSLHAKTVVEWRRWLAANHATERGVWLVSYKRVTGKPFVEYEDAVLEALCVGWVDGQLRPLDEARSSLLFTPRRPGSGWARSNKLRVAKLIREGRMRPAGLAKVAAAKRDGSWTLLDSVEALEIPAELRRRLAAAHATKAFDALPAGVRKQHLYQLVTAKRPETRAKRIDAIIASLRA